MRSVVQALCHGRTGAVCLSRSKVSAVASIRRLSRSGSDCTRWRLLVAGTCRRVDDTAVGQMMFFEAPGRHDCAQGCHQLSDACECEIIRKPPALNSDSAIRGIWVRHEVFSNCAFQPNHRILVARCHFGSLLRRVLVAACNVCAIFRKVRSGAQTGIALGLWRIRAEFSLTGRVAIRVATDPGCVKSDPVPARRGRASSAVCRELVFPCRQHGPHA
jgi:hypothetical protein